MGNYEPLRILPELERKPEHPRHWWTPITEYIMATFTPHIPFGRKSIESQLGDRVEFAEAEWLAVGPPLELTIALLKGIQKEMQSPTWHFIPDDPLFLTLIPEDDFDFPIANFGHLLREQFHVRVSREEVLQMWYEGNWTLGRFARELATRMEAAGTLEAFLRSKVGDARP